MDVKTGSGAQFPELDRARELAQAIVEVAAGNGLPTTALLTDMNQVLGRAAGNSVEVRESIDHLTGAAHDERLLEVTLALCAEALVLGSVHSDVPSARSAALAALQSGRAAERFGAMVAELGGPARLVEDPDSFLPRAPVIHAVPPAEAGVVTAIDVRAIGIAVVGLGGGRARETDIVDPSVGVTEVAALGETVDPGQRPLALVHAADEASADRAAREIQGAFALGERAPEIPDPVIEVQRAV
jgi:thymidine phosphorylase